MDLFNPDPVPNLLPRDGEVTYTPQVFPSQQTKAYFERLQVEIPWQPDKFKLFGREMQTAREVALFGDTAYTYTYSQQTKTARMWTKLLLEIKHQVEEASGYTFNSCLLNLYPHGEEGMGWHSDNEPELGPNPIIASLSLGARRKFVLKHKLTQEKVELWLDDGSLLLMAGTTQHHWLHTLPKTKKVSRARINLTFRTIHILPPQSDTDRKSDKSR